MAVDHVASLAECDESLALGGVAGLSRQRHEAGRLLLDRGKLLGVEERRRIGGTHNLGALAEFTPGGVATGRSEDE